MWQHYAALLFHYVLGFSLCLCHHCIDAGFHLLKKKIVDYKWFRIIIKFWVTLETNTTDIYEISQKVYEAGRMNTTQVCMV